jgi:DNA-binding transcriptional LysR family regulator
MALSGVDLNLLPILDALLCERNVTRAAERMSVGQPAMSSALARLRKQLGDPLLVREGRVYRLSALAESLVVPVRELVASAEAVLGARAPFDPLRAKRTFTVMTSDYVTMVLLKPLLVEVATTAPGIQLNVVPFGADFDEQLRRAAVDLLICPMQLSQSLVDLPRTVLFEDNYVLVGDRDHPDLQHEVSIEKFAELHYAGNPALVAAQLEAQGVFLDSRLNVQPHVIVPFLLTGTRLVSLIQERLARSVCAAARLRIQPSPVPLPPLVEAMHWSRANTGDPAHQWLRESLVHQAAQI